MKMEVQGKENTLTSTVFIHSLLKFLPWLLFIAP